MDHPLNQASIDGLDEMDKILKGMAELDGDTTPHADASLEALRRGEKSLKDEWPVGMDENVEKLIKAARNAREQKPNTDVTVEGQVAELVEAANEKLQRATKNSVRDALRTYDEVLASGAQGEYLVPLLVNRAIALDALGECSAAAESVRLAMDALPPDSEKRQELQRLRDEFESAALEKPTDVPSHEGDAAAMLNALNAPPEPAEGGAPFPPPPPPASIPAHKHVRRGPPLRFSESDRSEACTSKDAGNLHLREGNVSQALVEYGNAIKKDPDDAILWSNRSVAFLQLSEDNDTTAAQAAADALRAVTCDPNWPRGYCTLGDALLRLGSPLEALEAFLDGARVARDAGRLEDAFELDRKGRDARDAVLKRRPCVCSMASETQLRAGPAGDGAFERAAQERNCPEGARPDEERHV
uniref:Uncharacterized protein n=1 Tax=Pelagomonas calceolata TaxID=35677 RepID=A0A7S3ZXY3_9STRA